VPDPMRYRLEHYPLIIEQVVTWGDNVVYFRHMENARVELYSRLDFQEERQARISEIRKRDLSSPTSTSCVIND
jgi:hypothetical protein